MRSALSGKGGVKNRIKAFEMTTGSESSSLSSVQSEEGSPVHSKPPPAVKPPIAVPRVRVPQVFTEGTDSSPSRPITKPRSNSVDYTLAMSGAAQSRPSPPPKKISLGAPPLQTIPVINEQLVEDPTPPLPGRPPRPNVSKPKQPPRPSPSVYQKAKDRCRSVSPNPLSGRLRPMAEESEDSDTNSVTSTRSTPLGKPRHKVKKCRSQSSADQALIRPLPPTTPTRRKSASESTEDLLPPLEAPPKNSVGGATAAEDGSLNEEMAGTIIKYILASPDPRLKEALKDLIKNNEGALNTLK